jgi:hypothetical protein
VTEASMTGPAWGGNEITRLGRTKCDTWIGPYMGTANREVDI